MCPVVEMGGAIDDGVEPSIDPYYGGSIWEPRW
jgi:hypothetical protein